MAEASPYGPDWPDLTKHRQLGHGRLRKPLDGHTWHGDIDVGGFVYQGTAIQEMGPRGSILVVRLYFLPPDRPLVEFGT